MSSNPSYPSRVPFGNPPGYTPNETEDDHRSNIYIDDPVKEAERSEMLKNLISEVNAQVAKLSRLQSQVVIVDLEEDSIERLQNEQDRVLDVVQEEDGALSHALGLIRQMNLAWMALWEYRPGPDRHQVTFDLHVAIMSCSRLEQLLRIRRDQLMSMSANIRQRVIHMSMNELIATNIPAGHKAYEVLRTGGFQVPIWEYDWASIAHEAVRHGEPPIEIWAHHMADLMDRCPLPRSRNLRPKVGNASVVANETDQDSVDDSD